MREGEVGIHIHPKEGIRFVGIDEVNQHIRSGYRVAAIEPGVALMDKLDVEGGDVQFTLTGCTVKVVLEGGPSEP